MIVYQHRIYRVDLQNSPSVLYVFGDNLERVGMGGQAGEMRHEPNAVGVATKKSPGGRPEDYFSDDEIADNIETINVDYRPIWAHHNQGGVVVIPADGIGTGLSEMPTRCPKTFAYLCRLGLGGPNG